MEPFCPFESAVVPLLRDHVDTDQIIPARFLKGTARAGLGEHLFADWRASDPAFPLNQPRFAGRQVLLVGDNFGCGSSREHAPWALCAWGFRAVVATSFADIFRGNALKNGLLPIALPAPVHARLVAAIERDPAAMVEVDLAAAEITLPGGERAGFPIDPFAQQMLLAGTDELGYLLGQEERIAAFERGRP
jgi:3-isopropylmalate/(R)-2-methylmalate dehydratase small subunit